MVGLGVGVCALWFLGLSLLLCCVSVVGAWWFALLFAVFGSGSLYLVWVWVWRLLRVCCIRVLYGGLVCGQFGLAWQTRFWS